MSSDWPEISIEELKADSKNAIAMGPFGSRIKVDNFVEKGVPVIKGGNLNGDFILEDDFDFLTEEKADELRASNAFRRDIVITHRGTIGQVGIIPDDSKYDRYVVSQSQLKVTLDKEKVNAYFVYYFLRSPMGQHRLLSNAAQVGVPAIAQASTSVKAILVPCPDLRVQDKVVEILLGIDKKIELNRQINQTLEQMAQAIFKSWFVDFDPVRAKMKGHDTGLPALIADLFPDELVESELGFVPRGWGERRVDEILDLSYGKALSKTVRVDGDIPVYGSGGVTGFHNEAIVSGPGIIVGRKGTVGSLYWEDGDFFPIDTVFYVEPKQGFNLEYIFYMLQTLGLKDMNTDAAVPGLNRNNAYRLTVAGVPLELVQAFRNFVEPIRKKICACDREINVLADIRDSLLPKILSGEIEIKDIVDKPVAQSLKVETANIVNLKASEKANNNFKEAVLIARLAQEFSTSQYPLGRFRYTKFSYFFHRKSGDDVKRNYLKKAAGPYAPWTKYQGPEKIAKQNGYIVDAVYGDFKGFAVGPKISEIDQYFSKYWGDENIGWLKSNFGFLKKEQLELEATVDFAMLNALENGESISLESVKSVIEAEPEWLPKLGRVIFSDSNIDGAIKKLSGLFIYD